MELLESFLGLFSVKIYVSLILFLVLCALSYARMTLTRTGKLLRKFPQIPKFPFVGSIPFFASTKPEDVAVNMHKAIEKFGRRFVNWVGHKPIVVISEADAAQKVLGSTKYIEKGVNYHQFHWLFGQGLITSNGEVWKEDRKLLSPSFKYQRFDGFLSYFNKYSRILVDVLDDTFTSKKSVNLHTHLARATMDFISESALGQTSDYQKNHDAELLAAVRMALDSFRTRLMKPWLTIPGIWDIFGLGKQDKVCKAITDRVIRESVKKRRNILATSDVDGATEGTKPFIDSLLETKSYDEIAGHIVTIFGAGFETTASGMNYTLFLLANNPKHQAKVHEELDGIFSSGSDPERDVTFSDLSEMKYLEMCIKESLRLFPPAPAILRHAIEDIDLGKGQVVPRGEDVLFIIREIHRDPDHFPQPDRFEPERFLPEACAERHPYAFIPFSAGPRNCLGMKYAMIQMKACLAHILRRFTVSADQRVEDLQIIYGMVLEPKPEIELCLKPRK